MIMNPNGFHHGCTIAIVENALTVIWLWMWEVGRCCFWSMFLAQPIRVDVCWIGHSWKTHLPNHVTFFVFSLDNDGNCISQYKWLSYPIHPKHAKSLFHFCSFPLCSFLSSCNLHPHSMDFYLHAFHFW